MARPSARGALKGLTPLPELSSFKKLFKDSGFKNIKSTKIIPGGSLYSIIAEFESGTDQVNLLKAV